MSSLIKKPSELDVQTSIKVLLYGQPGIGKSTLALSVPSPLMLDFDGGVHRVKPQHQSDTVQIRKWEDCADVLKEDLTPYKSLIVDTAGKMLDYMSEYIIKNDPKMGKRDGSLSLQGYGARKSMFINFLKQVSIMGKHIIFVAHDREEKNGDDKIIRPEIGGSSAGDLIKELDLVGYMEAIGKKRTISFDPCEKYYGKNTCDLPALIELPDVNVVLNNTLLSIFTDYQKSQEKRQETISDYNALIDGLNENIDVVVDDISLNEARERIATFEHIWDSKFIAGTLLNVKAKELGFKFDAKKGSYVKA